MRWTSILMLPLALAFAAPAGGQEQDRPQRHEGRRGLFGKAPRFLLQRFFGDVTPEQKESLRALGMELRDAVRPYAPAMKEAVKTFLGEVRSVLTPEEQARVKGAFRQVRSLPIPEKIGLARGFIGALNTAEMRADVRAFFRGAPDERAAAGDRIALAAARKFVAEAAQRAEIGPSAQDGVLAAVGKLLEATAADRLEIRAIAQEKIAAAWALLTPEQKVRIRGAIRFVRGWLQATAQE